MICSHIPSTRTLCYTRVYLTRRKRMNFNDKKSFAEYVAIVCIGLFITFLLATNFPGIQFQVGRFFKLLTPFYIGFGIAYILNRPINFIHKRMNWKRSYVITGTYLGIIFMIALFVSYLLPQIAYNSITLGQAITEWIGQQNTLLSSFDFGPLEKVVNDNLNKLTEIMGTASNFLLANISTFFGGLASILMQTVMGIITSIYMLADSKKMALLSTKVLTALFKEEKTQKITNFFVRVNEVFSHFLTGLIVEAMVVGFLAFIGLMVLGAKYALILAVIICFTNVIPYVGPFIGAVPAIIATLTYDPMKALWVALFIVVLQQLDGNVIGPRIMGNFIGLSPIWIILAITLGGGYAGLLGMILSIPLAAIIKIVLSELMDKRLQENT